MRERKGGKGDPVTPCWTYGECTKAIEQLWGVCMLLCIHTPVWTTVSAHDCLNILFMYRMEVWLVVCPMLYVYLICLAQCDYIYSSLTLRPVFLTIMGLLMLPATLSLFPYISASLNDCSKSKLSYVGSVDAQSRGMLAASSTTGLILQGRPRSEHWQQIVYEKTWKYMSVFLSIPVTHVTQCQWSGTDSHILHCPFLPINQ